MKTVVGLPNSPWQNLSRNLANLSPAYFGLVMATGIIAITAYKVKMTMLAEVLLYLNIVQYLILCVLYFVRLFAYPKNFIKDISDHLNAPGFFTVVAGTGILASQVIIQMSNLAWAYVLWFMLVCFWLLFTYAIFTTLTIKPLKPNLAQGINGGWLLAVVATQAVAVTSTLLAAQHGVTFRLELHFLALSMWLWGGMLYILIMAMIFYRYVFFQFSPAELTPPYWINMGAMAISTLAGSLLILNSNQAPFLLTMEPFLRGFTVFYWAAGTWWIPMLVLLGIWRYIFKRFPFRYNPMYWGAVFPFGMYAACTLELNKAIGISVLDDLSYVFFHLAILAWLITFLGMLYNAFTCAFSKTQTS